MKTRFKMPHLPARGTFTTTKREVIEQCERARRGAEHGGFVALRGHPVFIRDVKITTDAHGRAEASIRYERVGASPRSTRGREVGQLRRELMSSVIN